MLWPTFSLQSVTNHLPFSPPFATHLGLSPGECHTGAHSLLNKPEASESGEIRLHSVYMYSSVYFLSSVSGSMVCVHPLAFRRTNLSMTVHPHTRTYARATYTIEGKRLVYLRVSKHVNGNVESSSCKQMSVRTEEDRKLRLWKGANNMFSGRELDWMETRRDGNAFIDIKHYFLQAECRRGRLWN